MFSMGANHFSGTEVVIVNEAGKNSLDVWVRGGGCGNIERGKNVGEESSSKRLISASPEVKACLECFKNTTVGSVANSRQKKE